MLQRQADMQYGNKQLAAVRMEKQAAAKRGEDEKQEQAVLW